MMALLLVVSSACRERAARQEAPAVQAATVVATSAPGDSTRIPLGASAAGSPESARVTPSGRASLPQAVYALTLDGVQYTVRVDRYLNGPDTADARVRVYDAEERLLFDEDLRAGLEEFSEVWAEFRPGVLENAEGTAQAFYFQYVHLPSAPMSGASFQLLRRNGDEIRPLFNRFSFSGTMDPLVVAGERRYRLPPGNRFLVRAWRYSFAAVVPLQLNLRCAHWSEDCIRIALPDSIAGLARFGVEADPRPRDSVVTITLYSEPKSAQSEPLRVAPADRVEILGGAGRVLLDESHGMYLEVSEDWLHVRVGGRDGWIHGEAAYIAIGLPSAG